MKYFVWVSLLFCVAFSVEAGLSFSSAVALFEKKEYQKAEGIFKQEGNVYKFTSNYIFSSPSGAAAVVLGRSANGWLEWKYQDGRTLDEVKRQNGE